MKLLVFESLLSGHRAYYVKVLVDALAQLDQQLRLAIPNDANETPEGREFLNEIPEGVEVVPLPKLQKMEMTAQAKERFQLLSNMIRQTSAEHVFVPYADGIVQANGMQISRRKKSWPMETQVEGLMMRGGFAYPADSIKQKLARSVTFKLVQRSNFDHFHWLDPLAYEFISQNSLPLRERSSVIPEVSEPLCQLDRSQACRVLDVDESRKYVVCPGTVTERKGIDRLIRAFERADLENTVLLLFGKHSNQIKRMLNSEFQPLVESNRIISRDAFVSTEQFDSLFIASDLVVVPYPRHIGSASILVRAARAGCRILGSDWGWIGWAISKFELGKSCDVGDLNAFSHALELTSAQSMPTMSSAIVVKFNDFHSLANHQAHWTARIRNRLNLPELTDCQSWSTVFPNDT